ncbi:Gfo/Idh/MocA family protein [Schaalia turicensis]|uniref:Gfo/Idh/MocA family protein n=1 Tax=Schaalia turicensis TaxID=131111 RepID=UPI0034A439A2
MTIRLGILGIGSMGRHHVRIARQTDGVELVALVDPAGDRFGVANGMKVLPGVDDMISQGIDAAIVAVPTVFHEQAALSLADAGVHTLVEKPLAASYEAGKKIVEAFDNAGVIGAVGYVERCNPALMQMRQRIADGQLGRIFQISTRRQSPFPARISDVGVVKDLATHDIDLAQWVTGNSYRTVFAQTAYRSGREDEDMLVASGCLDNGILVNHQINWLSPYKDRTTIVVGEKGALVADTAMADLTFYENGSTRVQWDQVAAFRGVSEGTVTRYAIDKREPLVVELENFRDAINGIGANHVSMREALETLRVTEAILESAREGCAVTL